MLSSQISSISSSSVSPLLLQSSTTMLRSATTVPSRRIHHQSRANRFSIGVSYIDTGLQRESWRRHRATKRKPINSLNRGPAEAMLRVPGYKEFMCSAWPNDEFKPPGRWVNIKELNDAIKDEQKPDGGSEGADQSVFDRLLNKRDGLYNLFQARSRALRDGLGTSSFLRHSTSQNGPHSNPEPEYYIDPITNKKVYRNPSESDPTRKILEESETQPYKPYFAYEPDGKIPNPVQDGLRDFDNGESYKPYFAYEPDGKIPDPVQDGLKDFDSGESYKPYFAYEPDGKKPDGEKPHQVQEGLKDYDAGESYKPYFAYEPDGKKPHKVQDGLKDYDSGESYKPYFAYEPDGKKPHQVQDGLKDYDAGVSYEPYFAYEPDGKIPHATTTADDSCPVQEGLKDYDMSGSYGPVMYREPDGKLPETLCSVQEGLKAYDNITSYEPRSANDPANNFDPVKSAATGGLHDFDCRMTYGTKQRMSNTNNDRSSGSSRSTPPDESNKKEDLDLLRASDVRAASGIIKGTRKETKAEKRAKREELEAQYQQLTIENSELQNVASHLKGRVNSKLAEFSPDLRSEGSKLTGNFAQDFPEEFEAKWTIDKTGGKTLTTKPRVDAWGYDKTPQGLELSYEQEVQNSEKQFIDGLASADSFSSNPDTPRLQTSLDRSTDRQRNSTDDAFCDPAQEVREIRARYAQSPDSAEQIKLQNESDPYSKEPQGLETHYAEEKRLENEMDPYSKKPQGLETHFAEEQRLASRLEHEMDPYSKEPQGLETHFEEEKRLENDKDPYSKRPQGLETSFAEECAAQEADPLAKQEAGRKANLAKNTLKKKDQELVREVRGIYEDVYGKIDSQHRQAPQAATTSQSVDHRVQGVEPTMYTILAYDPATKSVSTAETTSIVPDSAQPLTPSEALLRLTHPTKFIPHFKSLKAEGYEIVSGSGDILVWRKVQPSSPMPHLAHSKAMNPIDGTRSSPIAATGNFASPTGFVNHDLPEDSSHRFKSNIDVRREEDVFSGKSSWSDDTGKSRRKKRNTGKNMLLGAAWLGGLSYTLGVVAEYFKTGGSDGLGPQGF